MNFFETYAARTIARIDQEEATFEELFTEWVKTEGNQERLARVFDSVVESIKPNSDPLAIDSEDIQHWFSAHQLYAENYFPDQQALVAFFAQDGMMHVRFGDLLVDEDEEFLERFANWFKVYRNRLRLAGLQRDLGDWNKLLIDAFRGTQLDEAIVSCFASYRIRQLTSKVFSKLYFSEEEPAE